MRRSRVEHRVCSVYDLSPDWVGTFDIVFCGSLLLHLQNPLGALVNIRSVTDELAIIETAVEPEADRYDQPWVVFGHRESEERLGEACVYWRFSTRGLREMMEYAGFGSTQPLPPFFLPPAGPKVVPVIGYPGSTEVLEGRSLGPSG
jgi:tRNA (mo5U34)-methyltransferase